MITHMRRLLLVSVVTLTPALGGSPLDEHTTPHFTFRYPSIDRASIGDTAARVEREYARIVGALGVTDMPRVTVTFYTSHAALEAATTSIAGEVPPWAYGLVTAEDQIHCMSPNLKDWGPYDRRVSDIVHELAHAVTLHVNPTFANNPRWLWEAVAIYVAGQDSDPRRLTATVLPRPPALTQLNELADKRIYDVGYSIGELIESRWGGAALRKLVSSNGDTAGTLGISLAEFEAQWASFVVSKARAAVR
jgi:hypothetical protein